LRPKARLRIRVTVSWFVIRIASEIVQEVVAMVIPETTFEAIH